MPGGAVYNLRSTATFAGCQFLSNRSDEFGGALYGVVETTFEITDSHFETNSSTDREADTSYGHGGAISGAGSWRVADSTFMDNRAKFGGAISMSGSLDCDRCAFVGNQTITYDGTRKGGALRVSGHANVKLRNVLFSGNVAGYRSTSSSLRYDGEGSAIYVGSSMVPAPTVTIIYGTFSGNMNSGQPDVTSVIHNSQSQVTLLNSILWNADHPEIVNVDGGVTTATYSCVEGGMGGEGNIDENPGFLDPDGEDNLLGTLDDSPRLSAGSQAKDAGSDTYPPSSPPMTIDLDGEPRIVGVGPDMGAYEVQ